MLRKVSSLTALLSFIPLLLTSVILYIVPAGRVAYWADWRLWGLTKTEWTNLHVNLGVLFLIAILFHTWLNWNSILAYLRSKTREIRIFTPAFNLSLALVMVFSLGTYAGIPPFSTIIAVSEGIKNEAAGRYGEPPYGHAELSSLKTFAKKTGLDLEAGIQRLRDRSIVFKGTNQTLLDIAKSNNLSPKDVFLILQPETERPQEMLPEEPPAGLGRKPLAELCREYTLDLGKVLSLLSAEGITVRPEMNIREIAEGGNKDPVEVYDTIRNGLIKEIGASGPTTK